LFAKWNFSVQTTGLSFVALAIAYFMSYCIHLSVPECASTLPAAHSRLTRGRLALCSADIKRQVGLRKADPSRPPEDRMWILQYIVPLLPLGLLGFAFTSLGPAYNVHWIGALRPDLAQPRS
jgi:hypothetical protein